MMYIKNDANDGLTSENEPLFVEITGKQIENSEGKLGEYTSVSLPNGASSDARSHVSPLEDERNEVVDEQRKLSNERQFRTEATISHQESFLKRQKSFNLKHLNITIEADIIQIS